MGAVVGAVTTGASLFAQSAADAAAGAAKSTEYQRAMRAARLQEVDALVQGARDVGVLRAQGTLLEGQQALGQAAGNIDTTTGTAADVQVASRAMAELDASTARNNARRKALGFKQVQQQLTDAARAEAASQQARDVGRAMQGVSAIASVGGSSWGGSS